MQSRVYIQVRVWSGFGDEFDPMAFSDVPDEELYHTLRYLAAKWFDEHSTKDADTEAEDWWSEILASPPSVVPKIDSKTGMLLFVKYGFKDPVADTPKWTVIHACDSMAKAESIIEAFPAFVKGEYLVHWDILEQAKMEQVRWLETESRLERFDVTARPLKSLLQGQSAWKMHPLKKLHDAAKEAQRLLDEDDARRQSERGVAQRSQATAPSPVGRTALSELEVKLKALQPAQLKAWKQYKWATGTDSSLQTDREVYDWLLEQVEPKDLPSFSTWCRSLRSARKALDENKNRKRAPGDSRSVQPRED